MKIGIEAQRLFRKNKHGMDFVALELIANLRALDPVNEYVVFVSPGPDVCLQPTANFKICTLAGGFYPWWEQIQLCRAAREEKVDLLHCTSNTGPIRLDLPMVLTLHDIIYLETGGFLNKSKSLYQNAGAVYRRLVVPRIIARCAKIITVSEFEKKRIAERLPAAAPRLVAVYNGIGENYGRHEDQDERQKIRKNHRLPLEFILFLGNTDPKKNVRNVLLGYAAYVRKASVPLPLVLVDYPGHLLKKNLDDWGIPEIENHIVLPGYIERAELATVYAMASLFLYPSLRESFGLPILESMACGTPVITSDCSSMPEVAGSAALLVDPENPGTIGDAILQLQQSPALRERLVAAGLKRAAEFSWKTMAAQVHKLYLEVLAETTKYGARRGC